MAHARQHKKVRSKALSSLVNSELDEDGNPIIHLTDQDVRNIAKICQYLKQEVVDKKGFPAHPIGKVQKSIEILLNGLKKIEKDFSLANPKTSVSYSIDTTLEECFDDLKHMIDFTQEIGKKLESLKENLESLKLATENFSFEELGQDENLSDIYVEPLKTKAAFNPKDSPRDDDIKNLEI